MLAPGFKDTSDHFMAMLKSLDNPKGREEYGFLGISSYLGSQGETSNEVMTISYWRNTEGLHAFAESPVHREGWDWWNRTVKQHPHMVIFHEIYKAERKNHENIYFNSQPILIGGTSFQVKSDEKEEQHWVNPLVDANRGVLATSKGRLGLRGSHQ
jgi:heme-degrading monooxygenase HmoA